MAFDINKLGLGKRIAGASAVLLFIDMFLHWYSGADATIEGLGRSITRTTHKGGSAWDVFGFIDILLFLVIVATLVLIALAAMQRRTSLPVAPSVIIAVLGAVAALFVLYRIINPPSVDRTIGAGSVTATANVTYGIILGLLLCLGIAYGGFRAMREEGTSFGEAKAQAEAAVASRGGDGPASSGPSTGSGAPSSTTSTTPSPSPEAVPPPPPPPSVPPSSGPGGSTATGEPPPPPAQGV